MNFKQTTFKETLKILLKSIFNIRITLYYLNFILDLYVILYISTETIINAKKFEFIEKLALV